MFEAVKREATTSLCKTPGFRFAVRRYSKYTARSLLKISKYIWDPAPGGVLEGGYTALLLLPSTRPGTVTKQTTGARWGGPGEVSPPGTAAVSNHETGTVTKQTTGAVSTHETGTVTKQTTGAVSTHETGTVTKQTTGAVSKHETGTVPKQTLYS